MPEERQKHKAITCSAECNRKRQVERYRAVNPRPKLCTNTAGALSEYKVIVDLISKGFEIFKAVSPSSSCDLALLKEEKLYRIEVRTGFYTPSGAISHNLANVRADIVATVLHDQIIYLPPLDKEE